MKKILSLLLSILMLTSAVFSVNFSAYASEIESIDFEFADVYVKGLVIYPVYIRSKLGNKLILHMSDGTDIDYVCSVKDGEKVFLASNGDVIKPDDISYADIKVVEGENPIEISYAGFTANSCFKCVPNTVSGISFAFADGVSLTEGQDLNSNGKYNIASKLYSAGNVLTVSYSDRPDETYTCTVDSTGKYYSFVNSDNDEILINLQGYVNERALVPGQLNDVQILVTTRVMTVAKLMLNHAPLTIANAAQPSCTANGYTGDSVCSVCGAVFSNGQTIPAKGHSYVENTLVNAAQPSCTANGYTGDKVCSICGAVPSTGQVIPATGHSIVNDAAVPASYYSTGLTAGCHCSICNCVITAQNVIQKKKLKATSIKKLTKGKKQFKVTLSKVSGITGYQITYSTSSKFTKKTTKTVTVKGNKNTSKTINKLNANKKYYVKVRTYKTEKVNGKTQTAYSSYSKVSTIKTAK